MKGKFLDRSLIHNSGIPELLSYFEEDEEFKKMVRRVSPVIAQDVNGNIDIKHLYQPKNYDVPAIVSREFAVELLKWRSEVVTFHINNIYRLRKIPFPTYYSTLIALNKKHKRKVIYRLPTQAELKYAQSINFPFPNYKKGLIKYPVLTSDKADTSSYFHLRCIATIRK